jgi:hypothetical protein
VREYHHLATHFGDCLLRQRQPEVPKTVTAICCSSHHDALAIARDTGPYTRVERRSRTTRRGCGSWRCRPPTTSDSTHRQQQGKRQSDVCHCRRAVANGEPSTMHRDDAARCKNRAVQNVGIREQIRRAYSAGDQKGLGSRDHRFAIWRTTPRRRHRLHAADALLRLSGQAVLRRAGGSGESARNQGAHEPCYLILREGGLVIVADPDSHCLDGIENCSSSTVRFRYTTATRRPRIIRVLRIENTTVRGA